MAKNSGVVRTIDDAGRIAIPKEFRNSMGVLDGDKMEMTIDGDRVIVTRYSESCVYCGSIAEEFKILGRPICASCRNKLREQVQGIG